MSRILITGANGFVGKYMCAELKKHGYTVFTSDICGDVDFILDILNQDYTEKLLREQRIDAVVNLAGFSSVLRAWKTPLDAITLNVNGTISLLTAVKNVNKSIRVLLIGSSQEYGAVNDESPINEEAPLKPSNPYAISKNTQEQIAISLSKAWGLDIVLTRSFNHYGIGQEKGFVIADFASSIAAIELGMIPYMTVENTDVYRDFTDVNDVVSAYRLLLEKGVSREVYNVGSGRVYHVKEILEKLVGISTAERIPIQYSDKRKAESRYICCDNSKLKSATGWELRYELNDSLEEILNYWREIYRRKDTENEDAQTD